SDRVATRLSRRLREARHCKTSRVGPLWGSAAPLRTLRVLRYAAAQRPKRSFGNASADSPYPDERVRGWSRSLRSPLRRRQLRDEIRELRDGGTLRRPDVIPAGRHAHAEALGQAEAQ